MEPSKEIKAMILLSYPTLNMWVTRYRPRKFTATEMFPEIIDDLKDYDGKNLDKYKYIMKPLSEITDEDATEVGKIVMGDFKPLENGKAFIKQVDNKEQMTINFHPLNVLSAFQYLISEGYDIPQYYLVGRTLKEAGLAVYEEDYIEI